jgi:hypothetical protein
MEIYTLLLVTASNFMGIIPVMALFTAERYFGACMTTIAMVASIIMNSTETRRNMPALFLAQYSKQIRDVERIIACSTGIYGIYLFLANPVKTLIQVILPLTGAAALFGSDHVQNLKYYTILQIYWHFAIYMSLYLVIH